MINIDVDALKPGDVLARSVSNPKQPAKVLMPRGYRVEGRLIDVMRQINIRSVWVEEPGADALDDLVTEDLLAAYRRMMGAMALAEALVRSGKSDNNLLYATRVAVGALYSVICKLPPIYAPPESFVSEREDALNHSAMVCYISLFVAAHAPDKSVLFDGNENPADEDFESVGLGALFHDIGLLSLPEELLEKESWELSGEEAAEYKTHCVRGYKFLRSHFNADIAGCALSHHVFTDGSGYPASAASEVVGSKVSSRILPSARLVCLANAYEQLVSFGGYSHFEAIEEIMCARRHQFDEAVLKQFAAVVPPFCAGSMVTLSSGHHGAVFSHDPKSPFRPQVLLLREPSGKPLDDKDKVVLDMCKYPKLTIKRVSEKSVEHLLPQDYAKGWEGGE